MGAAVYRGPRGISGEGVEDPAVEVLLENEDTRKTTTLRTRDVDYFSEPRFEHLVRDEQGFTRLVGYSIQDRPKLSDSSPENGYSSAAAEIHRGSRICNSPFALPVTNTRPLAVSTATVFGWRTVG